MQHRLLVIVISIFLTGHHVPHELLLMLNNIKYAVQIEQGMQSSAFTLDDTKVNFFTLTVAKASWRIVIIIW